LVETLNTNCIKAFNSRHIRGNSIVTRGKAGERKRKSDNSEYEEKAFKKRVDGFARSEEAIKMVFARNKKIEKLTSQKSKRINGTPSNLAYPMSE
jgi:hypothetical protein